MAWLARWTSCDPVKANAPRSSYAYGRGNPISYVDPTGTEDSHAHGKKHSGGHKKGAPNQKPKHKAPAHKAAPKPSSAAPATSAPAPAAAPTPAASASAAPAASAAKGPPPALTLPTNPADGAAFVAAVKSRLSPGHAVEFEDRGVHVVVMPLPTPSIVHSSGMGTFTTAATNGDSPNRPDYVINGLLYERDGLSYRGQGLTIESGAVTDGRSSPGTFYFAWNKPRGMKPGEVGPPLPPLLTQQYQWKFGAGNPPAGSEIAMGGGKPMIINGLPYGDTNRYGAGAPKGLPTTGDPGPAGAGFLEQRSNAGFAALNAKGPLTGNTIMGVVPGSAAVEGDQNLLVLMVHEHGADPGISLAGMRDSLVAMGASNALAFDGSDSATLVRDSTVVAAPGWGKNQTIPVGLRFRP